MPRPFVVIVSIAGMLPTLAHAQPGGSPRGFTVWLNEALVGRVKVAISTRSNANQAEAPSLAANASTLVDTSSASDLIGMALNLADLSAGSNGSDEDNDATSGAVTASAYVLWAAGKGANPLDPAVYCGNALLGPAKYWRRVSFTLGFDDEDEKDTGQDSPIVAGAKAILWTERDVCDEDFSKVQQALESATKSVAAWSMRVQDHLYDRWRSGRLKAIPQPGGPCPEPQCKVGFINRLSDGAVFEQVLSEVGEEQLAGLITDEELREVVNLDVTAREAIDEFRGQPQLSASMTTKQRENDGVNEYRAQLIFDKGINDRLGFTANGSWDARDGDDGPSAEHGQGGRIAAALQFEPIKDPLFGPKTLRISLGGEAAWAERVDPIYRGQLKLNLPIPRIAWLTGVELPISVSVANRAELVDESEVRGLIGFSIDTSQLLAAVR